MHPASEPLLTCSGCAPPSHVVTFNMDEYCIDPAHEQSYASFMWCARGPEPRGRLAQRSCRRKHLFRHIDINPSNVHIPNGNAEDLEAECVRYELAIRRYGGIELFLAGIGPDGHMCVCARRPAAAAAGRGS